MADRPLSDTDDSFALPAAYATIQDAAPGASSGPSCVATAVPIVVPATCVQPAQHNLAPFCARQQHAVCCSPGACWAAARPLVAAVGPLGCNAATCPAFVPHTGCAMLCSACAACTCSGVSQHFNGGVDGVVGAGVHATTCNLMATSFAPFSSSVQHLRTPAGREMQTYIDLQSMRPETKHANERRLQ